MSYVDKHYKEYFYNSISNLIQKQQRLESWVQKLKLYINILDEDCNKLNLQNSKSSISMVNKILVKKAFRC